MTAVDQILGVIPPSRLNADPEFDYVSSQDIVDATRLDIREVRDILDRLDVQRRVVVSSHNGHPFYSTPFS
jgi:hypothetical protein